jgi:hypothetical protein
MCLTALAVVWTLGMPILKDANHSVSRLKADAVLHRRAARRLFMSTPLEMCHVGNLIGETDECI